MATKKDAVDRDLAVAENALESMLVVLPRQSDTMRRLVTKGRDSIRRARRTQSNVDLVEAKEIAIVIVETLHEPSQGTMRQLGKIASDCTRAALKTSRRRR